MIDTRPFHMAMDGSVKDHRGDGVVILIDINENTSTSIIPADGNKQMDSFYEKANALLAGLLLIEVSKKQVKK